MALPMTRRDSGAAVRPAATETTTPTMTLVAGRRRYTWFAVLATMLLMSLMVGAVLIHTTVAERQLQIDELEYGVRENAATFDELRAQRAELRSPQRLANEAGALGMAPGVESSYVDVDPALNARMIALSGINPDMAETDGLGLAIEMDPIEQYELVKSVGAELP